MPGDDYVAAAEPFDSYEQNALAKALALAHARHGPALADDSGIEVAALGAGPGVRSARTPRASASPAERNQDLLERLAATGDADRRARYVCVCALVIPGAPPLVARGEVEGAIADAPRGSRGFGHDPIFYYPPLGRTFGELAAREKNDVSHRGRALRALRAMFERRAAGDHLTADPR
jgi:XTP/dITP diphosphohydrolase